LPCTPWPTADRRHGLAGGGIAALGVAHGLLKPSWVGPANLALVALGALAVAAGDSSRNRRAYLAEAEQRAARAQHEKDTDARRRVTEERLRIARDLHDSVGHHLALISVQSAVADRLLGAAPGQAHEALSHVQEASRSALEELRDTIGLLREAGEPAAPTQPTPGLDGLTELVASFRASGLQIEQDVGGKVRRLAPAANLTAYRVIQESLTNVCKHAGNPGARLRLAYEPAALHITIDDNGTRQPLRVGVAAAGGAVAGTASSECESVSPLWAVLSRPGRARAAASGSAQRCRSRLWMRDPGHDHPGVACRRPASAAGRSQGPGRHRA
jgi:hypothetical protein